MHYTFAAAKVSTFVVSDFCVVWDFDCQRLCITPQGSNPTAENFSLVIINVRSRDCIFLFDNVCMYVSYSLHLLLGSCYAAHINV